jgi:small-conductance mechanosensitive channel
VQDYNAWSDRLLDSLAVLLQRLAEYLPSLLAAVALLLAGWLLGRLLKSFTVRLVAGADRLWHRLILRGGFPEVASTRRPSSEAIGKLVFWLVMLFFVTAAADIMGIKVFAEWLSGVVAYLPTLLAGGLILLGGALIANLARDLSETAAASAGLAQSEFVGRAVQIAILSVALLIGAEQIGVQVTFLVSLFTAVIAALFGGAALAFGLGARGYVRNLIAARTLRQRYDVGQRISLAGREGAILEITATAVVLQTSEGEATVPAGLFDDEVAVLLGEVSDESR